MVGKGNHTSNFGFFLLVLLRGIQTKGSLCGVLRTDKGGAECPPAASGGMNGLALCGLLARCRRLCWHSLVHTLEGRCHSTHYLIQTYFLYLSLSVCEYVCVCVCVCVRVRARKLLTNKKLHKFIIIKSIWVIFMYFGGRERRGGH